MVGLLRITAMLAMVVLVFTVTVQAQIAEPGQCFQANEVYNLCGSACPETCGDILDLNPPKPCTHECVIGCYCEKGYVRENEGPTSRCIKAEQCR